MPQFVQHAHLDDHERATLAAALQGAAVEDVLKDLRKAINTNKVSLETIAKAPTLTAKQAEDARKDLNQRIEILRALQPLNLPHLEAFLRSHVEAERILAETLHALQTH